MPVAHLVLSDVPALRLVEGEKFFWVDGVAFAENVVSDFFQSGNFENASRGTVFPRGGTLYRFIYTGRGYISNTILVTCFGKKVVSV